MKIYSFFSDWLLSQYHGRIILLFAVVLFSMVACEDGDSSVSTSNSQPVRDVIIRKVEQQLIPVILPIPGTVVSKNRLKVASRITGFIEKITVDEGAIVQPGDILVEIDNAQVEAAIKSADATVLAAKADLLDAKGDVIRIAKLVKSKIVAKDDLRNANVRRAQAIAKLATAEAEVTAKRQDRRYSNIISPVHALVRERLRDPGDLATAGEPILQLDVVGDMELEIYLPSTSISNVTIGQLINVQVEFSNELLEGKIINIVRSVNEITRRYKVRLLLPPNEKLAPGQFGKAQIILRNENVIVIPTSAITERAGIEGVFIVDDSNTLRFRSIRLGKAWQDMRVVIAGLESGTLIVTNPSIVLHDGDVAK
ncbi:MAG: efflux RND transporter periplasmic adaptor subunit [Sulfuriflexus sp.]|nr:efflux RND transporter periplasmic adaptor subunit [Sulfuriflexus sp.]